MVAGAPDLDDAIRAGAREALENIRLMLQDLSPGISIELLVQAGQPHEVLIQCALDENAQIIVLGSKARGRFGRLFVGSVAQKTMRDAPCAVLVCREGSAPFAEWAAGKRPLKVVAGVDRGASSGAAVAVVAALRKAAPCDVTLEHEYWPPGEYARLGLRGPRDLSRDDEEVVAVLHRELRDLWAELPPLENAGTVATRVRAGWSAPGLELALDAEAAGADLLVMGTKQAHGLQRVRSGSDALTALQNCHVPVLIVPTRARPVSAAAASIPQLRTVLVATDLSAFANGAIPHAYSLVRRAGARVEICHVHERAIPTPAYVMPDEGAG
ncbi:MAG TPA: universal stress protein, partial [Polyangia bacterium]